MKKIFLLIICFVFMSLSAFAVSKSGQEAEALKFFKTYETAANNYDSNLISYYDKNAKILRVVIRPDGSKGTAVFEMKDYASQLKIGQTTAMIRNYKNNYTNVKVKKYKNGYKITSLRQPSGENYKLNAYFVVSKTSGKWLITEEMMETKVQLFNNYVKK